jgi:hypothetical protein
MTTQVHTHATFIHFINQLVSDKVNIFKVLNLPVQFTASEYIAAFEQYGNIYPQYFTIIKDRVLKQFYLNLLNGIDQSHVVNHKLQFNPDSFVPTWKVDNNRLVNNSMHSSSVDVNLLHSTSNYVPALLLKHQHIPEHYSVTTQLDFAPTLSQQDAMENFEQLNNQMNTFLEEHNKQRFYTATGIDNEKTDEHRATAEVEMILLRNHDIGNLRVNEKDRSRFGPLITNQDFNRIFCYKYGNAMKKSRKYLEPMPELSSIPEPTWAPCKEESNEGFWPENNDTVNCGFFFTTNKHLTFDEVETAIQTDYNEEFKLTEQDKTDINERFYLYQFIQSHEKMMKTTLALLQLTRIVKPRCIKLQLKTVIDYYLTKFPNQPIIHKYLLDEIITMYMKPFYMRPFLDTRPFNIDLVVLLLDYFEPKMVAKAMSDKLILSNNEPLNEILIKSAILVLSKNNIETFIELTNEITDDHPIVTEIIERCRQQVVKMHKLDCFGTQECTIYVTKCHQNVHFGFMEKSQIALLKLFEQIVKPSYDRYVEFHSELTRLTEEYITKHNTSQPNNDLVIINATNNVHTNDYETIPPLETKIMHEPPTEELENYELLPLTNYELP